MSLSGKKIAVLAEEMYDELEMWYPYYRLKEAGADVIIVGSGSAAQYASKHGLIAKVDVDAGKISAGEIHGVVIPGGFAPDRLRRYPAVLSLVKTTFDQGKLVAAICHAGWVLVSAGVLKGRKATCVAAIKDDVVNAGAIYLDQPVVVDGSLITARTPADLPAWMPAIITFLEGK